MSKVTFEQFKIYLVISGVVPGCDSLALEEHTFCIENCRENFGDNVTRFFMDCFMPEGKPVCPGIEDSLSHYSFTPETWEELENDWKESHMDEHSETRV
jgi:hypothetical protein